MKQAQDCDGVVFNPVDDQEGRPRNDQLSGAWDSTRPAVTWVLGQASDGSLNFSAASNGGGRISYSDVLQLVLQAVDGSRQPLDPH
jgi:hypothetical protein